MKKLFLPIAFLLLLSSNLQADNSYFIDFKKVLNKSKAGAEIQAKLKKNFGNVSAKYKKQETDIRKEEANIISQKKTISNDDYKKKVETLRKKVAEMQEDKKKSYQSIAKLRNDSRQALLKAVNPIIKKYMDDNNIKIVINKASILMGDETLEITNKIITILDKEVSSLKIN
jgi:Skp family chaperone for outer membrane proteins